MCLLLSHLPQVWVHGGAEGGMRCIQARVAAISRDLVFLEIDEDLEEPVLDVAVWLTAK